MTDIIARLRDQDHQPASWQGLAEEAAAEIERLQNELAGLDGRERTLVNEIERLENLHAHNLGWETRARKAETEIERLRNERKNCPPASESEYVRRLEDDIERRHNLNRVLRDENDSLRKAFEQERAEVEQLRELLKGPDPEIERLHDEIETARLAMNAKLAEIERLEARVASRMEDLMDRDTEIERLRKQQTQYAIDLDGAEGENERLHTEARTEEEMAVGAILRQIERLRDRDDLVERLRKPMVLGSLQHPLDEERKEAADEIVRLRNERTNCPPASESEYVRRLRLKTNIATAVDSSWKSQHR